MNMDADRWRRIEELFDKVLDCPPTDRTAFLDSACADDPALKTEVTRLLALHEKAPDSFLNTPALQMAEGITVSDAGARTLESNGQSRPVRMSG